MSLCNLILKATSHGCLINSSKHLQKRPGARLPLLIESVDRIDSDGDYTVDNIQLMTVGYNILKSDAKTMERVDNSTNRLGKSKQLLSCHELLASEGKAILPTSKLTSRLLDMDRQSAQIEVKTHLENDKRMTESFLDLQSQEEVAADEGEEDDG